MLPDSPWAKPATEVAPPTWERILPRIPDHELLRCIGRGSYGEVWLARNVMGTYRAVKVVYRQSFDSQRPYEREFAGIQKFEPISRTHESQVDILHVGRNDQAGYFYYVMELADNANAECGMRSAESDEPAPSIPHSALSTPHSYLPKTLRSELHRRGRIPVEECLKIALSLTTALEHLHGHGLVHRDIKPSNVIFVNGRPKLGDIGLVAALDQTVSFVGTQGYVPPEGPGRPQADLYSLGKVLYEIATRKDRQEFPEVPTDLEARSDERGLLELNEIILKTCHHDPAKRYQSAAELEADLLLLQSGKSVVRLRKLERRLGLATKAGTVTTIIALVAGGGFYEARRAENAVTRQLVRLNIAHGQRLMDEGDLFGSLLRFTEALRLEEGQSDREAIHRVRIGSVLSRCPKLEHIWFLPKRLAGAHPHAAFSPDGILLVLSDENHVFQIWQIDPLQPRTLPLKFTNEVLWPQVSHAFYLSFSPDGKRLLTAEPGAGVVRVLDSSSGELVCPPLKHKAPVWDAKFSRDSQVVATASGGFASDKNGEATLWNASSGEMILRLLENQPRVRSIEFSPDGRYVVTAGANQACRIWDVATKQPVTLSLDQAVEASGAGFSPDGQRVAIGCLEPHEARVIDLRMGQLAFPPLKHEGAVFEVAFSNDGRYIATASGDRTVRIWDAANGQPVCPPHLHENPMMKVTFASDSSHLVAAGLDGVVHVWRFRAGRRSLPVLKPAGSSGNFLSPGVQFSPDKRHVVMASTDGTVRLWDLATEQTPHLVLPHQRSLLDGPSFSPNGRLVATKSSDAIRIWDVRSGEQVLALNEPTNAAGHGFKMARFSQDGRCIVTESSSQNATNAESVIIEARVWDVASGRPATPPLMLSRKKDSGSPFTAFSLDLSRAVTVSDREVQVWDLATAQPVGNALLHGTNVYWAALSPDGERVATTSVEKMAQVWDVATGRKITPALRYTDFLTVITFSPDGRRIVARAEDGTVPVWNARSGKLITVLGGHNSWVTSVEFSLDGRRLVTRAADGFGVGAVWDSATGKPVTPFFKNLAIEASFSRDGSMVFTLDENRSPRVLEAATGDPITPSIQLPIESIRGDLSPDGRYLVAAYRDDKARVWKLPKDERPVNDLVLLAQVLAAHKLDANGGLRPLEPTVLSNAWQKLGAKYPDQFRRVRDFRLLPNP